MPQFKIGGVYHSLLHADASRRGHFVVIAEIVSPTQVRVHLCTSQETYAARSVDAYGLLGDGPTYIVRSTELVEPSKIKQYRCMLPSEIADELGI